MKGLQAYFHQQMWRDNRDWSQQVVGLPFAITRSDTRAYTKVAPRGGIWVTCVDDNSVSISYIGDVDCI